MNKLALLNGNIITINKTQPRAEALLVYFDKIVKVGTTEEIKSIIDTDTNIIDLKGRTLIPGFIDCHAHPRMYGLSLLRVDCRTPPMKSIKDIIQIISQRAQEKNKGVWIQGSGYDDFKLLEKRHPNRYDLDKAAPNNPVIITRLCGHISVVNSLALEMAGISKDSKDPEGGQIDIDSRTGEPNGVLRGSARAPVYEQIPQTNIETLKKGIELAVKEFHARGVTSVSDAGVESSKVMKAYRELQENGMKLRVNLMMSFNLLEELTRVGIQTGYGDEWLKIGAIKLYCDGSFSGRTAAMFEPFLDTPDNVGIMYTTQYELDETVYKCHRAGYQVGIHAIGDRAISIVLNSYEAALKKNPKKDHRFRIEHCGINNPNIINRIKELGVIPVPQPIFLYGEGESYRAGLTPEMQEWAYPFKTWLDNDIHVSFSSDCPATSGEELINPLLGIYVAVNRKTDAGNEVGPTQKIDVESALKAYTLNSAYATFEENLKGSIEEGKLADFVVLSEDPTTIETTKLKEIKVHMTFIGGKIVYQNI